MVVAQPPVGVELAITLRPELVKLLLKVRDLGDRVLQSGVRHGPQVPGSLQKLDFDPVHGFASQNF